jgi:hypothetical protein
MKLLLHVCCAPCSIVPIDRLRGAGHELTGFWFNPNVHPWTEHEKRRETVEAYAGRVNLPVIWRPGYEMNEYLRQVVFHEDDRCRFCFRMRMFAAAEAARQGGLDAFTTTLLYSKYQKHDLLAEVAEAVSREIGVPFHYEDFRPWWSEGVQRSREMGMYRQKYCGCVYSEWERYNTARSVS